MGMNVGGQGGSLSGNLWQIDPSTGRSSWGQQIAGGGTQVRAIVGPYFGFETALAGLYFYGPSRTLASGFQPAIAGNDTTVQINFYSAGNFDLVEPAIGAIATFQGSGSGNPRTWRIGFTDSRWSGQILGALRVTTRIVNANLTIDTTQNDYELFVDTSAARTITLPPPASSAGRQLRIYDRTGTAGTNAITLAPNGAEAINGTAASLLLRTNWGIWTIACDGTNWFVTGG